MIILEALKKYKRIVIVDQMDLQKEYQISWGDVESFLFKIEKSENFVSDMVVKGFEEVTWEAEIDGLKIRDTTTYGIGSITELEIIGD